MLHACFVYDRTCFMCIFIQYLAFSGTNLLTRCHSAGSCFLMFFLFQKSCTGNILGIAWNKLPALLNHVRKTVPEGDLRGAARWPDPTQARPDPGPRLGDVWAHQGARDAASSPIYSSFRENPRHLRENPRKVPYPPSSTNPSRECSGALP